MAAVVVPRVLVVGPAAVGKKTVVDGLAVLAAEAAPQAPANDSSGTRVQPLLLRTKYYAAQVEAHVLPSAEFQRVCLSETSAAPHVAGAEAMVLVLDGSAPPKDALALAEAWQLALSHPDVHTQPETRLCLVNERAPGDALAEMMSLLTEWALDNGWEAVSGDARSPLTSWHGRERTGVARVMEALHSTMWSNMDREAGARDAGGARGGASGSAAASAAASAAIERDDAHTHAEPADAAAAREQGAASVPETKPSVHASVPALDGDDDAALRDDDDDPLDIARMMADMRRVRDAARDGTITDEQRRDAAAAMAMKLFELLGGHEEDGEHHED